MGNSYKREIVLLYLIMGYGKLCLGISDINENAPSDNKAYVRKRTINDK